jgi:hypothetical protein
MQREHPVAQKSCYTTAMEIGRIKTLYKDALPNGELPTMEKVTEAYLQGEKADPYMFAYLKYRPELVSLIRVICSNQVPLMKLWLASQKFKSKEQEKQFIENARMGLRKIVESVENHAEKDSILVALASPETVIQDCARIALAKAIVEFAES